MILCTLKNPQERKSSLEGKTLNQIKNCKFLSFLTNNFQNGEK